MGTDAISHERHNLIDTRTAAVLALGVLLLFLPPSVTMFRNPLPAGLAPMWWLRFGVSAGVLSIGLRALFGRNRVRGWGRGLHWAACAVATAILLMLLQWPLEYPYPFGLPNAVRDWWSH